MLGLKALGLRESVISILHNSSPDPKTGYWFLPIALKTIRCYQHFELDELEETLKILQEKSEHLSKVKTYREFWPYRQDYNIRVVEDHIMKLIEIKRRNNK